MEMNEIFTTKNDEWGTPRDFFNELDKEFDFTLDPCGDKSRRLKEDMITWDIEDNGLTNDWSGHRVYCNPPYSGANLKKWCEKIYKEKDKVELIVLLCPIRKLCNHYFHDLVLDHANLRIVKGRLNFIPLAEQNQATSNPSGSALCIIDNREGI